MEFRILDTTYIGDRRFSCDPETDEYLVDGVKVTKEEYYAEYHKLVPEGTILKPIDIW